MSESNHHLVTLKFITAIVLGLVFAFLLIYVFVPEQEYQHHIFNLQQHNFTKPAAVEVLTEADSEFLVQTASAAEYKNFRDDFKASSFKLMDISKETVLNVLTANQISAADGIREEKMQFLAKRSRKLAERKDALLQEKREELETRLNNELQQLRSEVKNNYADYSQHEIRDNYLEIINLKIAIAVIAETEAEKNDLNQQIEQVEAEQQKILQDKQGLIDNQISAKTRKLIIEFNHDFSAYRQKLTEHNNNLLKNYQQEIEVELANYRDELKRRLASSKKEKSARLEQLIEKSQKRYY